MKKALVIVLALLMVFAMFACGQQQQEVQEPATDKDYVQQKGNLIVGITDFEPMDYMENGQWVGFDADMAKEFAKWLGVEVEFIEIDWDNKELELNNKTIDCVWNGMTLTDGVKAAMETSNPYCNNQQIIVVNKDIAASITTAEDAKDLKFAVEAGSAGAEAAEANGYDFTEVDTQSTAVMNVAAGTAEACIIDSLMAAAMVGAGTSYPDLMYTVGLTDEEYGVGFRKGSNLAAEINDFFKSYYGSKKTLPIAEKYGVQASIIG